MKVFNIMNFCISKNYDTYKKPKLAGIEFVDGVGQEDSHGYSYGFCRKQLEEIGDVMGLDSPQLPYVNDCLRGVRDFSRNKSVEDGGQEVIVPYCSAGLDACCYKGDDINDGQGGFICDRALKKRRG